MPTHHGYLGYTIKKYNCSNSFGININEGNCYDNRECYYCNIQDCCSIVSKKLNLTLNNCINNTQIICEKSAKEINLEKSIEWGLISLYCTLAFIIIVILLYSLYCLRKVNKKVLIKEILTNNDDDLVGLKVIK